MSSSIDRVCWCHAKKAEPWFRASNSSWIIKCTGCGVCVLWPVPSDEELRESYAQDYYGSTPRKFVEPIASYVELHQKRRALSVSKALRPPAKILDVGCGNGGVLHFLHEEGFDVEGTEWSPESAARIPTADIVVHVGELLDLNLKTSDYDAIILWHVLEHVRDPFATLKECHRLLTDHGLLFLSVPNTDSWEARVFRSAWFHLDTPRHLYHFNMHSLSLLLRGTGFDIQQSSTWSLEQNPFAVIQSTLNAVGFPHQRAYCMFSGTSYSRWPTRALDAILVSLLAPMAFVVSVIESICGRGGIWAVRASARDL